MQDKNPEIKISKDEEVIVPTMDDVKKAIKEALEEHIASRDHPYATLEDKGFVTLSNEIESDSEITVATSSAIKKVYDLAKKADSSDDNYVPISRKVNGKALSSDISLNASDIGAYTREETDNYLSDVKTLANTANQNANTRLSKDQNGADIPDKAEFVKTLGLQGINELAKNAVPNSRRINGKVLTNDVNLNASDVGAQQKGNYQPTGNYALRGECYTKQESDARYSSSKGAITSIRQGERKSEHFEGETKSWESPSGAVLTGLETVIWNGGRMHVRAVYYRIIQVLQNGQWITLGRL